MKSKHFDPKHKPSRSAIDENAWALHRVCAAKKSWTHQSDAETTARTKGKEAYKCRHCGKWHLATPRSAQGKEGAAMRDVSRT